jgi:hypothetical protein
VGRMGLDILHAITQFNADKARKKTELAREPVDAYCYLSDKHIGAQGHLYDHLVVFETQPGLSTHPCQVT